MAEAKKRGKTFEEALESFRRDIITGRLGNGQTVTEQALCDRYGVSRSPIRAALSRLEEEGFIRTAEGGSRQVTGFDERDAKNLFELRKYIESKAVTSLIKGRAKNYIPLLSVLTACQECGEKSSFPQFDFKFHRSIIVLSEDKFLLSTYDNIAPVLKSIFFLNLTTFTETYYKHFYDDHMNLFKTIINENEEDCLSYISRHIDNGYKKTLEMLDKARRGELKV